MKTQASVPHPTQSKNNRKAERSAKARYWLGRLLQDFHVSLREGGYSKAQRVAFMGRLERVLGDQGEVRREEDVDLCSIADKVYRLEHGKGERQELCRTVRGFFSHALGNRSISHTLFQKVLLFFWVPESKLPPGVMSLDEIRTALREAPTPHAKTGLIFALTMDFSALPLNRIAQSDVGGLGGRKPNAGKVKDEMVDSLISWLMALPQDHGLLMGTEQDFLAARMVLKRLGFSRLDAFRQTRIAYHAALAGPVAKFATSGGISPDSLKKYSVPGLDAWAGYAFHYGITPESCGIRNWPSGCPISEPPARRRRVRTVVDADNARAYF